MSVRFTIYTIKYGLVIGAANYALQYASKYIMDFKIIRPILLRANHILSLVGLLGILIAFVAFIEETVKRIIKKDNPFNFFKAILLTAKIKRALFRVDEFDPVTGKTNPVSKSFNKYTRWSYGDFDHNKIYIKVKIPLAGQANKIWKESKEDFRDLITSNYMDYSFMHTVDHGYYTIKGIKNEK